MLVEVLATVVALQNVWSERIDYVLQQNIENHHRMVLLASINNRDVGIKGAVCITANDFKHQIKDIHVGYDDGFWNDVSMQGGEGGRERERGRKRHTCTRIAYMADNVFTHTHTRTFPASLPLPVHVSPLTPGSFFLVCIYTRTF